MNKFFSEDDLKMIKTVSWMNIQSLFEYATSEAMFNADIYNNVRITQMFIKRNNSINETFLINDAYIEDGDPVRKLRMCLRRGETIVNPSGVGQGIIDKALSNNDTFDDNGNFYGNDVMRDNIIELKMTQSNLTYCMSELRSSIINGKFRVHENCINAIIKELSRIEYEQNYNGDFIFDYMKNGIVENLLLGYARFNIEETRDYKVNVLQQRIGIWYKDDAWRDRIFKEILSNIPKDSILKVTKNREIILKDNSKITMIRANMGGRGQRFNVQFVQRDIDKEIYEDIIVHCICPVHTEPYFVENIQDFILGSSFS